MPKQVETAKLRWLRRKIILFIWDFFSVAIAMLLALLTEGTTVFTVFLGHRAFYICFLLNILICSGLFMAFHLYQDDPDSIGALSGIKLIGSVIGVTIAHTLALLFLFQDTPPIVTPYYIPLFFFILLFLAAFTRYLKRAVQALHSSAARLSNGNHGNGHTRVMIVGAGEAGTVLLREIEHSDKLSLTAVCLVDDDPMKLGNHIFGVPVAGNRDRIPELVKKYSVHEIYIAIPSLHGEELGKLVSKAHETGCRVKMLPGIYQLINGDISLHALREVSIEDLLARDAIHLNNEAASAYLEDKIIMVTGGGGSIGSELCRQIASHHPHQLIILDIYENNAYDIQQ
ncbi:MAG: polysaccharide biosynthesis protein, partial [Clostridia bacterium]|nr:polysaccharide biosynthesis protein [Clostridia bacterium]